MSEKSKHTPGPWTINMDSLGESLEGCVDIDAPSAHVGALAVVVWKMDEDEISPANRANAHLIAAAPDLLAAAKRVYAESMAYDLTIGALEDLQAAIEKAERQ